MVPFRFIAVYSVPETETLDHFIRFLFIFVPIVLYILHTFRILSLFTHLTPYFTFVYRPTWDIFLIPDDAVDQRKLRFQTLIFTVVLGLI